MPVDAGVVGIDEAGRGAWAGPLLVAAVGLTTNLPGLNDSKRLSKTKREQLAEQIKHQAHYIGVGRATPAEIDRLGLTRATSLAMKRALSKLKVNNPIIIDGPYNYLPNRDNVTTLIDADAQVPVVMAASIIAKVARDRLMLMEATRWPAYGFEHHVGYGTARHRQALKAHGICNIHRLSFQPIKTMVGESI